MKLTLVELSASRLSNTRETALQVSQEIEVQSWNPADGQVSASEVRILARAAEHLDHPHLGLTEQEQAELLVAVQKGADSWRGLAEAWDARHVCNWVKALTLAEARLAGFDLGSKSPVIVLIQHLKQHHALPDGLLDWVRSATTNRFLPYGNLQDRL